MDFRVNMGLFRYWILLRVVLPTMILSASLLSVPSSVAQSTADEAMPVELVEVAGRYQLLRGGRPYAIKGAGMESGAVEDFAAHGGNSLRTWSTGTDSWSAKQLLDEASRYDVTIALCIELGRERHGFDYDDEQAVARQLEYVRAEVMKYKDHPALLMWIIGNELNHSFTNPRVFDAVNDISSMIHAVDGKHPTTTTLSEFSAELISLVEQRAPDLDFVSFQLYAALDELPQKVREMGYSKPFMITEWGATGHWEVGKASWGAPIEMNSSEKAQRFLARYQNVIAANGKQIIGSYVFLWGQKQERTPTWYGMLLEDGSRTEAMDVMHYIWNGDWPQQRSPQVRRMRLDDKSAEQNVVLRAGMRYGANLDAVDPNGGDLTYQWEVMRESEATQQGGDPEVVPEDIPERVQILDDGRITLTAPDDPGAYRLFAHVYDGSGLAGHANIPFLVPSAQE
jgi:hypothetical protein